MGALDLEVHDLATGRVDAYHRQSPAHAWVHVGVSAGGTRAELVDAILGPTSPLGPLSRASSAGSSCCGSPGARRRAVAPAPVRAPSFPVQGWEGAPWHVRASGEGSLTACRVSRHVCVRAGAFASVPALLPPSPSGALLAAAAVEGGVSVTVARFAQQLQEAGAAVMAAAQLLQQWIDELRAASDAAAAATPSMNTSASAGRGYAAAHAGTPQLVTAAVSA